MTNENNGIIQANILIAEFMGFKSTGKIHPYNEKYGETLRHPDFAGVTWGARLDYHKYWNSFMPVWFKFRDLKLDESNPKHSIFIFKHSEYKERIGRAILYNGAGKPQLAHDELVDAIRWYNSING